MKLNVPFLGIFRVDTLYIHNRTMTHIKQANNPWLNLSLTFIRSSLRTMLARLSLAGLPRPRLFPLNQERATHFKHAPCSTATRCIFTVSR